MIEVQGIAGTYGREDRSLVRRMLDRLAHRGREVVQIHVDDGTVLGARCSSYECGDSPSAIAGADGLAVAGDSYIFNREFLRKTITPSTPPDASDAQLLLDAYRTVGARVFGYIDGAYAVVVLDRKGIIIARDPYGLKPMYISRDPKQGAFSSEMKSQIISGSPFVPFPPGKMFVQGEGYRVIQRRRVPWAEPPLPHQHSMRVRELIIARTIDCLGPTRAFNVLLSGGLDSSVVATAASLVARKIQSVCVGMEGCEDLSMARKVADALGTEHRELVFSVEDMLNILGDVVYASETFDYPLVRSCIPNLMATRMFTDRSRVTLCGEGGDEVFAGYDSLLGIRSDQVLRAERLKLLRAGHLAGFQRVDRMTAASSLDGRMPLMSNSIVEYGLSLGRNHLLGSRPEHNKLVLRKAFQDMLPAEVVWRRKRRFSDGAGSINALVRVSEETISDADFERERKMLPNGRIRTKEELMYYRIFSEFFPGKSAAEAVGFTPQP
ncbi:MAG: asparagine synthase-related protein [Thermoplasmata archaeon]